MNTKQQGDVGVAAAIAYYTSASYVVLMPLTDNARYDLVVEKDGLLKRVQVKTSNSITKYGSYTVCLVTSGGNKSGNKKIKKIQESECDLIFLYTLDGKGYEFLSDQLSGRTSINLPSKFADNKVLDLLLNPGHDD